MEFNCRVCLQINDVMLHVSEQVEEFQTDLATLLLDCGNLKISQDENCPQYMCQQCTQELLIVAGFQEKCRLSNAALSKIKAGGTKNISDIEIIEAPSPNNDTANNFDIESQAVILFEPLNEEINVCDQKETELLSECNDTPAAVSPYFVCFPNTETLSESNSIDDAGDIIEALHGEDDSDMNEARALVHFSEDNPCGSDEHTLRIYEHVCNACGASFVKEQNLQRHVEKEHTHFSKDAASSSNISAISNKCSTKPSNCHICSFCGKRLQSTFALETHLRTHTGERPFGCKLCSKQFKTRSALTGHMKRHEQTPDLVCTVCKKHFYDNSNLLAHMRIHNGLKPHVCNICKKSFGRVFLLQLHMRTHTGERPYQCSICEKSFAQSNDLKYHLATHTFERNFRCSICEKAFVKHNQLKSHTEKHHTYEQSEADELDKQ